MQQVDDHLVLFFVLLTGKFYTFGMLRTLNSRAKLRRRMHSKDIGRVTLGTWEREQEAAQMDRRFSLPDLSQSVDIHSRFEGFEPVVLQVRRHSVIISVYQSFTSSFTVPYSALYQHSLFAIAPRTLPSHPIIPSSTSMR